MPPDALAASLAGRIRSGEMAAGCMLQMSSIAGAYGVDTATVLQALHMLERDGVVTPCAAENVWRVRVPDVDEVADLLDMLEHLELFCLARQARDSGCAQSGLIRLHARLWQMCGEPCRRRFCGFVDGFARDPACGDGGGLEAQWLRLCRERRRIIDHAVAQRCRSAQGESDSGMARG